MSFIRATSQMNGVDGSTCDIDPNRIHELIEECRTSAPPLVDGETLGSDMEREKFDQVSCLHPSPLHQSIQGSSVVLTVDQGAECEVVSRTIQKHETIKRVVRMENSVLVAWILTREPLEQRPCCE